MSLVEDGPRAAQNGPTPGAHKPPNASVDLLRQTLRSNVRQYGMIVALLLIIVLFQIWTHGILLKPLNVTNLVQQNSYILLLAIGMVIVIISGHIDLSVGSVAAFVGAVSASLMITHHVAWPVALVMALLVGAAIGAWQGFWIAYVGVPSFIVTLAGMLAFRGATGIILGSQSISPFPRGFQKISNGYLPEVGPYTNFHNLTLLIGAVVAIAAVWQQVRERRMQVRYGFAAIPRMWFLAKCAAIVAAIAVFSFTLASYKGIPVVLIILIVLFVGYSFLMRTTVFGRHTYAVGGNEAAAKLSGVRSKRVTFFVFVNMGVLAALAGMVYAARLNAGTPQAGVNFELEAIAAAFIGGASASGGVGTVLGAIIGGLVLGVLNNGMSIVGVDIYYQQVIKGLVLLGAVGFDIYNKRKVGS
jgi:putative multiple sugar transport system permease protein